MRFAKPLCIGAIAVIALTSAAHPQNPDQSLTIYGAHLRVTKNPKESWPGTGVYLGRGLVITAAHLIGIEPWFQVAVQIAGKELPANVLKRGQLYDVDLTLLSVDEKQLPVSVQLRRLTICQQPSTPGEEVIVATADGIARSHVVSPKMLPPDLSPKYRTSIADVATTGNSGSGVFDAWKKCLRGIISAKIQETRITQKNGQIVRKTQDVAKYFVPAAAIRDFIPSEYRF